MAATTVIGLSWKRVTKALRSPGIVVMLMNSANISAPIRIRKGMAVVRALQERVVEGPPGQRAPPQREDHGAEGAHAGTLGGGEQAAVDPAHDEEEQGGHRPDVTEGEPALAPARALAGRARGRVPPGHV